MSAPLTPEQRETLERLADEFAAHASASGPTLQAKHAQTATAIRAALSQPARTCGSCKHDKCCGIQSVCVSSVFPDKRATGCIGGWTPRETETP